MRHPARLSHARALRACLAVTLGGAAGCTSRAAESDDTPGEEPSEAVLPITAVPAGSGESVEGIEEGSGAALPVVTPIGDDELPEISRPDAGSDVDPQCSAVRDGQCPASCDRNADIDCCEGDGPAGGLCQFVPDYGCRCAVIGPFNPPETPT